MIEASKMSVEKRGKLVVPINLSLRISGAFYAVYGTVGLWKLLQSANGSSTAVNTIACVILGAFCLLGLVLSLTVNSFALDRDRRRYCYRKGFGPFAAASTGDACEIRSITVIRQARPQGDPESGQAESFDLCLQIDWISGQMPLQISRVPEDSLFGGNTSRVLSRAVNLARAIGVPVENRLSQL